MVWWGKRYNGSKASVITQFLHFTHWDEIKLWLQKFFCRRTLSGPAQQGSLSFSNHINRSWFGTVIHFQRMYITNSCYCVSNKHWLHYFIFCWIGSWSIRTKTCLYISLDKIFWCVLKGKGCFAFECLMACIYCQSLFNFFLNRGGNCNESKLKRCGLD